MRFNVQQTGGRGAIKEVQMQGSDGSWQSLNNVRPCHPDCCLHVQGSLLVWLPLEQSANTKAVSSAGLRSSHKDLPCVDNVLAPV